LDVLAPSLGGHAHGPNPVPEQRLDRATATDFREETTMTDFQIYLIARQRADELQAEALAPSYGPGFRLRLASSLCALAEWIEPALQVRAPALFPRAYTDVTSA
jgi:hypothetical protein